MHLIDRIRRINRYYGKLGLSIGNFEGFHRGHLKIIGSLINECRRMGLFSAVITFKEHPLTVLNGYEPEKLYAAADKIECFKKSGIDLLFYIDFSPAFAATSPADFLKELRTQLNPKLLCLGTSFRFGRDNSGDLSFIAEMSENIGYTLLPVEEVMYGEAVISSTRIRSEIKRGKFRQVAEMLGRRYTVYLKGKKSLHTFISNIAIPKGGAFSGEMEDLKTGERHREVLQVAEDAFIPSMQRKYCEDRIYQFSFDADDTGDSES